MTVIPFLTACLLVLPEPPVVHDLPDSEPLIPGMPSVSIMEGNKPGRSAKKLVCDQVAMTFAYDSKGRLTAADFDFPEDPIGNSKIEIHHDQLGRLSQKVSHESSGSDRKVYSYDAKGHLNGIQWEMNDYSEGDDVWSVEEIRKVNTDSVGRITEVLACDRKAESCSTERAYTWNEGGLLARVKRYYRGEFSSETVFTYDKDRRLIKSVETAADTKTPPSTTTLSYDKAGRTARIRTVRGKELLESAEYVYDAKGAIQKMTVKGGRLNGRCVFQY